MKRLSLIVIVLFITAIASAQDTLYIYKGGAIISKYAVAKVDSITFTPPAEPTSGTVSDIDGNVYHWITIGSQKWMVENLRTTKFRTGESVSNVTDGTIWNGITFAAWCDYNNEVTNGTKYGHLYNWYAVNDSRNIAPVGWHIPSDIEWTVLTNYLITNGFNYDGTMTENKIAKSLAATTDWKITTGDGVIGNDLSKNNLTQFTALPGGARFTGEFGDLGNVGYWWSATECPNKINVFNRILFNSANSLVRTEYYLKKSGLSVRCIKD